MRAGLPIRALALRSSTIRTSRFASSWLGAFVDGSTWRRRKGVGEPAFRRDGLASSDACRVELPVSSIANSVISASNMPLED